jgi:hypothetical protein
MDILIWPGAGVSMLGVAGLLYCISLAFKARRAKLEPEEMQARMQRIVVLNMAALFVSMIGLMMVVGGIILG